MTCLIFSFVQLFNCFFPHYFKYSTNSLMTVSVKQSTTYFLFNYKYPTVPHFAKIPKNENRISTQAEPKEYSRDYVYTLATSRSSPTNLLPDSRKKDCSGQERIPVVTRVTHCYVAMLSKLLQ